MGLTLNATKEPYKEFYGQLVAQMPKLIAERRVPMNTAQLMQRRLDFRNGPQDVKTSFMDNYFFLGDAVVYHPNGNMKIVRDSKTLREMTPESPRNGGALVLTPEVYKTLEGEEFKKDKLGIVNDSMSKEDVKAHRVWKALAGGNQSLLNDYTDFIFAEGKQRFSYDTAMGIYPGSCNGDKPEMRAWVVGGLGDRSDAGGGGDLDYVLGRLVGIAPEALSASGQGASAIQRYSMADVQAAVRQRDELAQMVRPEKLEGITSLLSKL